MAFQDFVNTLRMYGNLLSHGKIDVRVQGTQARLDDTTVYLPAISKEGFRRAADNTGGEALLNAAKIVAFGFEAGQIAKVNYGDPKALMSPSSPWTMQIATVVEELRTELCISRVFPGTLRDLQRAAQYCIDANLFPTVGDGMSAREKVLRFVQYVGRWLVIGDDAFEQLAVAAREQVTALLSDGAVIVLKSLLARVKYIGSTAESVDVAHRIATLVKDEAEKKAQQQSAGGGGSPDQHDAGRPDAAVHDLRDLTTTSAVPCAKGRGVLDPTLNGALGRGLESLSRNVEQHGDAGDNPREQKQRGVKIDLSIASSVAARIEREIEIVMRQIAPRSEHYKACGTRLRRDVARALVQGHKRLFVEEDEQIEVNAKVIVLLDTSGSMDQYHGSSSKIEWASIATYALGLAMQKFPGIKLQVASFPGPSPKAVEELLDPGKTMHHVRDRFVSLTASGGTPLLPALVWAEGRLLEQEDDRAFLFVVSDGDPLSFSECSEKARQISRSGTEVVGLLIGPTTRGLFPKEAVLADAADLPSKLAELLVAAA